MGQNNRRNYTYIARKQKVERWHRWQASYKSASDLARSAYRERRQHLVDVEHETDRLERIAAKVAARKAWH